MSMPADLLVYDLVSARQQELLALADTDRIGVRPPPWALWGLFALRCPYEAVSPR